MGLYNHAMSEVHVAVEWLFGNIANYFKFIDFKSQLRINMSAVGKFYIVCALNNNNNNNNNNNLLLIWRKYLYEYIQMRLTSYIKIIIK